MQENQLIDWLQEHARTAEPRVLRGIGDDAAVLQSPDLELVVTTDLIADGSHFDSHRATARQIGRKAMAVNLSDIAAMAATPMSAFVSLLLPKTCSQAYAEELMFAMVEMGREFHCEVAGGDTNSWDGKLAINVTVIGHASMKGPLLRSTAVPGDVLIVTGALGGSISGHHFDFVPRVTEASLLHENYQLHAGMDLSDGLALDLRRMCAQSGCGAEVLLERVPISEAARQLADSEHMAIDHALGDGEDFELLLAVAPDEAKRLLQDQPLRVPLTEIGCCVEGDQVWQRRGEHREIMPQLGYEHGKSSGT